MKKFIPILILLLLGVFFAYKVFLPRFSQVKNTEVVNSSPSIKAPEEKLRIIISPTTVRQGDPALIQVSGLSTSTVRSIKFNGKSLAVFDHKGIPSSLVGIDLRMTPGLYTVRVELENGIVLEEKLVINSREIVQAPLGIPEKLGGNTKESERELVNTLVQEGALISAVPSKPEKLWEGAFRIPVNEPVFITDTYGYSRITGASSISHKGTDYRAKIGTPIYAMNSGEVRFVQFLRNYGNTIIIDHGFGLHSIYMHLSEPLVKLGERVEKGQLIAKSGDSGYTLGPHLHLTIRINGISIDPESFLALLSS